MLFMKLTLMCFTAAIIATLFSTRSSTRIDAKVRKIITIVGISAYLIFILVMILTAGAVEGGSRWTIHASTQAAYFSSLSSELQFFYNLH